MKISRQAWHYRLQEYAGIDVNPNFCEYFWITCLLTVTAFIWVPFKVIGDSKHSTDLKLVMQITMIGSLFSVYFLIIYFVQDHDWWYLVAAAIFPPIFAGIAVIAVYQSNKEFESFNEEKYRHRMGKEKEKHPNILVERFKAWKGNYCPRIEFDDD